MSRNDTAPRTKDSGLWTVYSAEQDENGTWGVYGTTWYRKGVSGRKEGGPDPSTRVLDHVCPSEEMAKLDAVACQRGYDAIRRAACGE